MIQSVDSEPRNNRELPTDDRKVTRKVYESPDLREWGSLVELTQGSIPFSIEDPDFNGGSSGI